MTQGVVRAAELGELFPPFVSYDCVRFAPGDEANFAAIELPRQLIRAVPKRRLEFLAGRSCAVAALRRLVPDVRADAIPVGTDRAPVWPAGVLGALTHSDGFAAAAVALVKDAHGVGLDSERIVSAEGLEAIATQAATAEEIVALGADLDEAVMLTLVFSAKESLFKCLYPRVRRYFDFHDATISDVSIGTLAFTAELRIELGGLPAGSQLRGRFALADGFVHTAITLPR